MVWSGKPRAGMLGLLLCFGLVAVRSSALQPANSEMGIKFVNVAEQAGIKHKTIYGGEHKNKYLLETTGLSAKRSRWLSGPVRCELLWGYSLKNFSTSG
jgi:hypothetical protein